MIIGTPLGCGCFGADAPTVPTPTVPVVKPKHVRGAGPRLVNPYNVMRSGRTPRWYGKDPRYALTNIAEMIRRQAFP
jgi:hypothetical protein